MKLDPKLEAEAKSLVALGFRKGTIEDVRAGTDAPHAFGRLNSRGSRRPR